MNKPVIVIKLKVTQFSGIYALAMRVYDNINLNPWFINPNPSMPVLQAATFALKDSMAAWGSVGNRGSHVDHVKLEKNAKRLHLMLTQLGAWCMSAVDPDTTYEAQTVILRSSGFGLKNAKTPQGKLGPVENFRRMIAANISQMQVKLCWDIPLGVTTPSNVKNFNVYRHSTNDFAGASIISSLPMTTYIDEPGAGIWYYWVVATNHYGNGVTSNVVVASNPDMW